MRAETMWRLLAVPLAACQAPNLNAVEPRIGYPRQLLAVEGETDHAWIAWDYGTPNVQWLYTGPRGTRYFQIPPNALPGSHRVALCNSRGTSHPLPVRVLSAPSSFPAPRIEDVALLSLNAVGSDAEPLLLTVSAANLDTGATLTVASSATGQAIPVAERIFWSGLPVDFMQDHDPETFSYPVYHYGQLAAVLEKVPLGTRLEVVVMNADGKKSEPFEYDLPADASDVDSDRDGLHDAWETSGYSPPNGGPPIDLPAFGCDPLRKDVLVEVDWMPSARPPTSDWPRVVDVFERAPVLNPDGSTGVHVAIDYGQGAPFSGGEALPSDVPRLGLNESTDPDYVSIHELEQTHFDEARLGLFHYCVFGLEHPEARSGWGETPGDEFVITLRCNSLWTSPIARVGTFVHELGHNLNLHHGGVKNLGTDWAVEYKPNLPSTMNYRWQLRGVSMDCDWVPEGVHTFSQGMLATIEENTANEADGICDASPLDLNRSGAAMDVNNVDANVPPGETAGLNNADVHRDYDQWGRLVLDFEP